MADNSIGAVVTDPPYGLTDLPTSKVAEALSKWLAGDTLFVPHGKGFVGQEWDKFVPPPGLWAEVLRVLKPGGCALTFCAGRTLDLMSMSLRLAGFDIRGTIATIHAQAMPKSLNIAKALRAKGNPDADKWEGWGTNLRTSNEPVIIARKPLDGTVANNVSKWGVGGLNIDATRVPFLSEADKASAKPGSFAGKAGDPDDPRKEFEIVQGTGRWPSDVLFEHHPNCGDECVEGCPVAMLDEQSGILKSGANPTYRSGGKSLAMAGAMPAGPVTQHRGADEGGASRFFPTFRYQKRATPSERPRVEGIEHPSVKSLALMRWLVSLVGVPGEAVLEPFAGSGTTMEAAWLEGIDCIGIEREDDYVRLIRERMGKHGVEL